MQEPADAVYSPHTIASAGPADNDWMINILPNRHPPGAAASSHATILIKNVYNSYRYAYVLAV